MFPIKKRSWTNLGGGKIQNQFDIRSVIVGHWYNFCFSSKIFELASRSKKESNTIFIGKKLWENRENKLLVFNKKTNNFYLVLHKNSIRFPSTKQKLNIKMSKRLVSRLDHVSLK